MKEIISKLENFSQRIATFWWIAARSQCARLIPFTSLLLKNDDTISKIPFINAILPFSVILFGFIAGIDSHAALPVYIGTPWYLAALLVISILSPFLGLLAFAGFIGGEILFFTDTRLRNPSLFFPLAITSAWIFLVQMLFLYPLIARVITRLPEPLKWLQPLFAASVTFFLIELWSRLAMIVLRPLFLWQGQGVDMQLIYFGETEWEILGLHGHMLAWIAAGATIISFALPAVFNLFQQRWLGSSPTFCAPTPIPSFALNWRPGFWHSLAWRCVIFTLLLAGLFTQFWSAALFAFVLYGAHTCRALAARYRPVRIWDNWMHAIPPLIRLALTYVLAVFVCYGLAEFLRGTLNWRTLEALALMILIATIITLPLWPQSKKDDAAPPAPWILRKFNNFVIKHRKAVSTVLWCGIILNSSAALAHHCSFQPGCECLTDNWLLAQTAAAAIFLFSLTPQGGWLEAAIGRDLSTGKVLQGWERMIRLIPGSKGLRLAAAGIMGKLPTKASILMNKLHKGEGGIRKTSPNFDQSKNIKRFINKVPSNAKHNVEIRDLPNGGKAIQATSQGKVTGSKAVYEKQIDINGKTIQYTKTTYDPTGRIIHVKDKIGGGQFP